MRISILSMLHAHFNSGDNHVEIHPEMKIPVQIFRFLAKIMRVQKDISRPICSRGGGRNGLMFWFLCERKPEMMRENAIDSLSHEHVKRTLNASISTDNVLNLKNFFFVSHCHTSHSLKIKLICNRKGQKELPKYSLSNITNWIYFRKTNTTLGQTLEILDCLFSPCLCTATFCQHCSGSWVYLPWKIDKSKDLLQKVAKCQANCSSASLEERIWPKNYAASWKNRWRATEKEITYRELHQAWRNLFYDHQRHWKTSLPEYLFITISVSLVCISLPLSSLSPAAIEAVFAQFGKERTRYTK